MRMNSALGIYVHVPFCAHKCDYCNFYSEPLSAKRRDFYLKALLSEIELLSHHGAFTVDTIYFGGGTPTMLPTQDLQKIMRQIHRFFAVENAEISIEANPETLTPKKAEELMKIGFNRISIGMQSACEKELKALGRTHDFKKVSFAVKNARAAGFSNISLDLMLGIPFQDAASLDFTISSAMSLAAAHISAYLLQLEPETPFFNSPLLSFVPAEDEAASLYLMAVELLEKGGYRQYEISNFAKPGFLCRHNLKYWTLAPYMGFGPAAYSFIDGKRYGHTADLFAYAEEPGGNVQDVEEVSDRKDVLKEKILLGLRLNCGVCLKDIPKEIPLRKWQRQGWVRLHSDRVSLTPKGMLISNQLIGKILCAL